MVGISDLMLRKQLLQKKKLDYKEAREICRASEAAVMQVAGMRNGAKEAEKEEEEIIHQVGPWASHGPTSHRRLRM